MKKFFSNKIQTFLLILFCFIPLALSVRGNAGSPSEKQLSEKYWKEEGPFELSPERGRFILTYALVENKSFHFSKDLALFGSPDVAVTTDKNFASLFAPAVSFITIPGYLIGRYFSASQVGTYSSITFFAILNFFLILQIAKKYTQNNTVSILAATIFLFATPAFAYAVNLYQHHVSTFLILLSLYFLINFRGFWSMAGIFFLYSLSITVDYPNLFLLFPIALGAILKTINIKNINESLIVKIKIPLFLSVGAVIFPMLFFFWFNKESFGNPYQLSGTLKTITDFPEFSEFRQTGIQGAQPELQKIEDESSKSEKNAIGFFNTRNMTNGFYIHLFSPDRGIWFFSPILLITPLGVILAYKRKLKYLNVFLGILGVNILLYSMWGDPWGGWAFGSRYLIPSYAISSIFLAIALKRHRKNMIFLILFLIVFAYSVAVNTLGAVTSSANPPKIEALSLEKLSGMEQKYTIERNFVHLYKNGSKSFAYRAFTNKYLTPWQHYYLVLLTILAPVISIFIYLIAISRRKNV